MKFRFLTLLSLLVILSSSLTGCGSAAANYPNKPVTMIIPWPPGGSADTIGRALAQVATEKKYFPQPIQVVNKPGGGGTIGTDELIKGRPDGYTIAYNTSGPIINQPLLTKLPYTHKDFTPVLEVVNHPIILAVAANAPFKTIQEFLAHVKQNPGKIRIGHPGDGSFLHLALMDLKLQSKLDFQPVPFAGAAPALTALLGGHIEAQALHPTEAIGQARAGKLRVLAVFEERRNPYFPEAPTFKEAGYNIVAGVFNLVMVPPKTPATIVSQLHDAFKKAMDDPDFVTVAKGLAANLEYRNSEDLRKKIDADSDASRALIAKLDLKK